MGVNTNFGSKLWISSATTTTATDTQAEFEVLTYTQVGSVESIGAFGDTYQDVTFTPLSASRTEHHKGTVDAGTFTATVGFDAADTGQDALMTALADVNGIYAFQVQLGDGSSGSPSAPTTQYFLGRVMAAPLNIGGANNLPRRDVQISVISAIIQVDAV
jgi:hypothetical protein